MDARRQVARAGGKQLAEASRRVERDLRLVGQAVVERRACFRLVEQGRQIGMALRVAADLVRVDAAEDQQVVVVRKLAQGPDDGVEAFVMADEAEDSDEHGVLRQGFEKGK